MGVEKTKHTNVTPAKMVRMVFSPGESCGHYSACGGNAGTPATLFDDDQRLSDGVLAGGFRIFAICSKA